MRILKLMAPAALGVSVAQLSLLINTQIASLLGDGAVSWLYYADRLMEFPSALLGVALGHRAAALARAPPRRRAIPRPTRACSTGACASTLLLAAAGRGRRSRCSPCPLISTLFWHGEFTRHDVIMTRNALIAYAVGLAGHHPGEDPRARLLREAEHPHAGEGGGGHARGDADR